MDRDAFVKDQKTHHAVAKVVEELCEAAYWFVKSPSGASIVAKYPNINFRDFGNAGNIFRHRYWSIDYARLWDDLHEGSDISALEEMLEKELLPYQRLLSKKPKQA
jgi:uncharacterized protein with HEPN domain